MSNNQTLFLSFNNAWLNLSAEALSFLTETTGGTSNFKLFYRLLFLMQLEETVVTIRGIPVTIMPGQLNAPMNSLQEDWGISRKCIGAFFDKLEKLGVIARQSNRVTTIIDMKCVFSWTDNEGRVKNAFFKQLDDKTIKDTAHIAKKP